MYNNMRIQDGNIFIVIPRIAEGDTGESEWYIWKKKYIAYTF